MYDTLYMVVASLPEEYYTWQGRWPLLSDTLKADDISCVILDALCIDGPTRCKSEFVILTSTEQMAHAIVDVFHYQYNQDTVAVIEVPAMLNFYHKGDQL